MGAQNVKICASNALIGMEPIPAQIGGYRVSSGAQRELQRGTRGRSPFAPDRRIGAIGTGVLP
jgi:hypothetical protein